MTGNQAASSQLNADTSGDKSAVPLGTARGVATMKYLTIAFKLVSGLVIALAAIGSMTENTTLMPDFAMVYMGPTSSTFFGPSAVQPTHCMG